MALKQPPHSLTFTVLGAGTMGAGIAAHLAATGSKTHLLDVVTPKLADRSASARRAVKLLPKARPPAVMSPEALQGLVVGNFEDDLDAAIHESDLVIEAVVERLDIKQSLWSRVARCARPHAILATNTSGIGIAEIAAALPVAAQRRFLGLHFFNPPRFMHLLEVIPGTHTDAEVVSAAADFCDRVLGKGIVLCRDTPNFIGNRIGIAEMLLTFRAARRLQLTVEEVDLLHGPLLGRPKTGSFRLADMVGLDVISHVVRNLERGLSADVSSSHFDPLYDLMRVPEEIARLVDSGRLGDKTGGGFYKEERGSDGRNAILSLDLATDEYRARQEARFPELEALLPLSLEERVVAALHHEGVAGEFLREVYLSLFNYSAHLAGVICETPAQIDDAMRWGYGWQMGPFEMMDVLGAPWVAERLAAQGSEPSAAIATLASPPGPGAPGTFYDKTGRSVFDMKKGWVPRPVPVGAILLSQAEHLLASNPSARLVDLGDGIACFEFRSKANILDDDVVALLSEAPRLLAERGYLGMVLGNQADHFCRGANLARIAAMNERGDWAGVEKAVFELQQAFMNLRHGPIPVVAAPLGQTLGGGTEACLHCAEVQAAAELYMGLVEAGVGLLPAGGGLKEIARRAHDWAGQVPGTDPFSWVKRGFEAVATAQVSSSAFEARSSGFLSVRDGITFHRSRVIADAKQRVLSLSVRAWQPPPVNEVIRVVGAKGGASLMMGVQQLLWGGYASEHDAHIARKAAHVLSGGSSRTGTTTAWELLDLEREAFVSLCGESKTRARIEHMLKTKRPLRN